ncbi:MAG TPA: hypothetical protein ENJ30_09110 [Desulfobulbaceae bacterium]|nr:hypothetical protein [Desulfobulbaceae bacterium]
MQITEKMMPMLLVVGLLLGGCTAMNSMTRTGAYTRQSSPGQAGSGVNTVSYQRLVKRYGSPARMIARATAEEINLVYMTGGYSDTFTPVRFNAGYTPTADGARIDLAWTSNSWFFPPGEYRMDSRRAVACNQREPAAFVELAKMAIDSALGKIQQAGIHTYRIEATFTGSADGLPVRRHLYYGGEYGRVRLTSRTTLNNKPHRFDIHLGERLTNETLAALRAVSLAAYLHGRLGRRVPLQDRFKITVKQRRGARYRTARLSITILDN